MPIIQLASSFLCSLSRYHSSSLFYVHYSECYSLSFSVLFSLSRMLFNSVPLFYVHYPNVIRALFSMFIISNVIRARFISSMLIIPNVILFSLLPIGSLVLADFPASQSLFYVHYGECYSLSFSLSHRSVLQLLL